MIFKKNDLVSYKDIEYKVECSSGYSEYLFLLIDRKRVKVDGIEHELTLVKKHFHKMHYAGAEATVLAYVKDKENKFVYLELFGQEDMVKSITSVMMMGHIKMNDHFIQFGGGFFNVNRAGNKRMLSVIDKGIVHTILYHSPSIRDTDFDILIGKDEAGVMEAFKNWMDLSNPMPYPVANVNNIFAALEEKELLISLISDGVEAVRISEKVAEDEYAILKEVIIAVSIDAGVMNKYDETLITDAKYELPKSVMMTPSQVQHAYDTLLKAPKTYETDGWKLKPIAVKLFGGNNTIYVTERDVSAGTIKDGEVQKQSQCYGYVDLGNGGEWGYLDFDSYIGLSADVPLHVNGVNTGKTVTTGLEMDLYFEDMYLSQSGELYELSEIKSFADSISTTTQDVIENISMEIKEVA